MDDTIKQMTELFGATETSDKNLCTGSYKIKTE